jgi:hypothetical protein
MIIDEIVSNSDVFETKMDLISYLQSKLIVLKFEDVLDSSVIESLNDKLSTGDTDGVINYLKQESLWAI